MKKNIGFIGCGKMAGALIGGIKDENSVIASEISDDLAKKSAERLEISVFTDNKKVVKDSEVIFVAVKPNQVVSVLEEIKDDINNEKLLVSIAAGVTIEKIQNILPKARIIRVMPNTPALLKCGMFGICKGEYASEQDLKFVQSLLDTTGKCIIVDESQMDIVTAISGSGPAFFYQVIEDMARAGEKLGLDYEKSLTLAAQTALGSANMIFKRGNITVQTLIDNVATKGGCTFVGIEEMKNMNSSDLFLNVIEKTTLKAHELGK